MDDKKKDTTKNLEGHSFTKENAAEKGRIGGKKAAQTRAKKKKLKECFDAILDLPVNERNQRNMAEFGIDDSDMSNQMLIAIAMFQRAIKGDVKAAEYIRDVTGQQPMSKMDKARLEYTKAQTKRIKEEAKQQSGGDDLSKLDELLSKIDELAEESDNGDET